MKKLTPLVMVAAFGAMMFASCKKDYTCVCTTTYTDFPEMNASTEVSLGKQKKKDAESACEGKKVTVPGASMECKLK